MNVRTKKIIFIALAFLAVIALAIPLIVQRFVRIDAYRDTILAGLKASLNRTITYNSGAFSAFFGPSFTFYGIEVKERGGAETFASAESVTFKLALLPLLEKKVVLRKVVVEKPKIRLLRDESGKLSIDDLLAGERKVALQLKGIRVKNGTLTFIDHGVSPETTTVVDEADFDISRLTRGKSSEVKLSGKIFNGRSWGDFHIAGKAELSKPDKPFLESMVDFKLSLKNIDATHYWPYYSKFVPFIRPDGVISLDSTFKGKILSFHSKGNIGIKRLRFAYPSVFHAVLTPQDVQVHYDMAVDPATVAIKTVTVTVDGLRVKGACTIADIRSGDPHIAAEATTSTFSLEKFRNYIPYGIIVKDTSEFIESYVLGGTYRLIEGKLKGRASQIAHMEIGDNNKVLYIRGTVEDGLLSFGKSAPSFNGIKGTLQLLEKDFILSGMSGKFGSSPFTLDGKIKDYCMNFPSAYPFSMEMAPNKPEIAWLIGKDVKLQFSGESSLKMSGAGTTDNFSLAGDWNISPASYSVSNLLLKPSGAQNHLSFKAIISEKGTRVPDARFTLPNVIVAANAAYRPGDKPHTEISLKSNLFTLSELKKFSPKLQQYDAQGKAQVTMSGSGNPREPHQMNWNGNILVEGGSYAAGHGIKRITDLKGTIGFGTKQIESSLLTGKVGNSSFYAKGNMALHDNPVVTVSFSSPFVDTVDLGFARGKDHMTLNNLQGNIRYEADSIQIRSLSGKVGQSNLKIRGMIKDLKHPDIDIAVTSPNLQTNDLAGLFALEREVKQAEKQHISVKASIEADTGKIDKTPFRSLTGNASYEDGILYLQPVELTVLGGKLSAKGRFDIGSGGMSRYQASFDLHRASAEQLLRAFDVQDDPLTGTVSVQGDITAKGATSAEIKRSLLGWLKFKAEEGTLRRFSVLSKVFSILNISQLLKFQLPDMVSGGMPYNSITGTISFRDGIASSKDIFVDSDAMNISIIGNGNLIKEEVDLTIGVQPLQTLDKVVNRIPIVGWILTGKGKTLITSYFEAKGKWGDPNVSAIPVKSMGKGVFEIFKRVFQLPEKLFTDTGEVIIGK